MLELTFDVEPDENGVIDGVELAAKMIAMAGRLIAPYVHKCPACVDAVFSHLANKELEDLHQLLKGDDNEGSAFFLFSGEPTVDRNQAVLESIQRNTPLVAAMVQAEGYPHKH